ncbi:MAG TPA: carboxy terminal-processing peptidase [Opitutales bacterium]|nr:carboxy terminal-processing peptidase [Opitutales bacterium]
MKKKTIPLLTGIGASLLAAIFVPYLSAVPTTPDTSQAKLADTVEMSKETRSTIWFMELEHYLKKPYAEMDQGDLLRNYMANLDSRHLFLLQGDVKGFQDQYAPQLVREVRELGDLQPAYAIFKKFQDTVHQRVAWINQYLDGNINLKSNDSYRPDRTDANWPATAQEADQLWEKQIRYEVLNELLASETRQIDAATKKVDDASKPVADKPAADKSASSAEKATPATDKSSSTATTTPAPKTYDQLLADAKETVRKRYNNSLKTLDETDAYEVQDVFLNTLAYQYDPHSNFFTENGAEDFDIAMRNTLIGIGAILQQKDDYCTISDLVPGGPAQSSNLLHPGDRIMAVGQSADGDMVDVVNMKLTKTVSLIRGVEGTPVYLKVIPAGLTEGDAKVIMLTRKKIELTTTLAKAQIIDVPVGDRTVPIGVINLPAFYGKGGEADKFSTTEDVKELIGKLKNFGVKGIVLDLRMNGGGFLNEAIDLTGLFIPPAPVLQVRSALDSLTQLKSDESTPYWNGPLMLLVSKQSASATEIFAGALQDYHRALIVGDHTTHGKGTVQQMFYFNVFDPTEKGAAKVTIEKWYLPDGNSIQSKGVSADIPLPSDIDFLPIGEGDMKNAMAWDSVTPLPLTLRGNGPWRASLVDDSLITKLRQDSEARQNNLPEFSLVKKRIAWEKARTDQKEVSLNFDERMAERRTDMSLRDSLNKSFEQLAKDNYKSTDILLDAAKAQQKDQPAKTATPPIDGSLTPDDMDPADQPVAFDVQLRESLRIMGDWLNILNQAKPGDSPQVATETTTSTSPVPSAEAAAAAPATVTH